MNTSLFLDVALLNGNVLTMDGALSVKTAVGIQSNKITAVGTDDQIKSLIGGATEVVDLDGKTVLPGINDSHAHTALWAGTRPPFIGEGIDRRSPCR